MAIDTEKVTSIMAEQDENVEYIMSVARTTAGKYTEHLDTIMQELYKKIIKSDEVPTEEIERNFLELTNLIYFMSDKLENLGAYDDISKANAKEAYNKAYLTEQNNTDSNKKKPTVAELTAVAEQESKYETVVNNVYATYNRHKRCQRLCQRLCQRELQRCRCLLFPQTNKEDIWNFIIKTVIQRYTAEI